MANIIVKKYEHYNSAMGKYIKNKSQYHTEMDRGGYVSQEKADQLAQDAREKLVNKRYELSDKAKSLINQAKQTADRKGNIKMSDNLVDAYKDMGIPIEGKSPELKPDAGGFYEIGKQ